ncbi:MAG: hypothetical protein JRJ42_04470 [Deltaproteobacteria bacterium]|nr:hypothetical protein [Deltaproteobacteria bacterium]MBW2019485.1 hypothetical protein [Deltaproteobacteria bacterium]MBW2074322.1 hypothetical protein [Deltaproteobacteria bacterium]
MAKEIEKRIETLIAQGKTKKEIYDILSAKMDEDEFERYLRNCAELSRKDSYYGWNLLLLATLAAVTFYGLGEIVASIADTGINNLIIALWSFVVPGVNIYLIWLIYRFNRLGYMFLFILSALSLLRPENRSLIGLVQTIPLIVLSGFLYLKLFPKGGKDY